MGVPEVLHRLETLGITLEADGDKLRYRAPKGALTPELRQAMLDNRAPLLAALLHKVEVTSLPYHAATACVCPIPIGGTGPDRYAVCQLPLICPGCGRCRGCKLLLSFPPRGGPYG